MSLERNNWQNIDEEDCPIMSISSAVAREADTLTSLVRKNYVSTRTELPRAVTVTNE